VHRFGYSPTEAAVATGLSLSTINRKLAAGDLKAAKVGRRRIIPPEELERLCRPQEQPA
jgi:excisionase family DNA binding protein